MTEKDQDVEMILNAVRLTREETEKVCDQLQRLCERNVRRIADLESILKGRKARGGKKFKRSG